MSLADQSQQWYPTSVQVTVHQARNLRVKGKNGTNDSYAIIQMAKDKFSTSVAEKCVDPVWKEEASFDLPLFHPGNSERCTLYIIVMHRAQVGLDKFLGQAVINLLDLHDNKSRKKTEWFKLVDKTGKEDKARGEVLLDIQFMRNNMSASMFDLSMQDKPRSRISKLKDKVRGKKKDGFSDSASAIVPSVGQVLTDSEGEADAQSLNQSPGTKKKSKLKTLFAPKSNLQRNISQSMSTLGTLPEKNSSLSGSRSSGLNVDSPDVKKKFKFLGHKRTGSSDSKVSSGPFALLGRSKQSNNDANNLCINGSHVYTEETEPKSGSTLSLNSSGQGSLEDVRKHTSDLSADPFKSVTVPSHKRESTDRASQEQQHHQEEEERRQAEERRIAEAKRLEEEEKHRVQLRRLQEEEEHRQQEEQERKRRFLEDEARRKKQMEEEERRKQEEQRKMMEAAENQRLEEERRKAEEQKRQEEASMSDRLSSLFGMIRKKDEKKEEVQQQAKEGQLPTPFPHLEARDPDQPVSHYSTNPFEDITPRSDHPLSSNVSPSDNQKSNSNPQPLSAMGFLSRTAKVSAVKPRLAQSLEPEPAEFQTPSQLCPSPTNSESSLSSVPSGSPDTFASIHSSAAPQDKSPCGSPCGSTENFSSVGSEGSSPTMANQKRKVLLPPSYGSQTRGNLSTVREIQNPAYVETDESQPGTKMSLPLPDYETLFPKRRHGVQGQTRWDHIIAEVNQKYRDASPELLGPEMSVDGPEEHKSSPTSSVSLESPAMRHSQAKPVSTKKVAAPAPPKQAASPLPQSPADFSQRKNNNNAQQSLVTPSQPAVPTSVRTNTSSRGLSGDGARKALQPPTTPASRSSQMDRDTAPSDDQRKAQATMNKEVPTAKPRQRVSAKEPTQEQESAVNSNLPALSTSLGSSMDKKAKENFAELDPFPNSELISTDPWAQSKQNREVDYLFTDNVLKEQTPQDQSMTPNNFDNIFSKDKPTDTFAAFNGSDFNKHSNYRKSDDDDTKAGSPVFQRKNSQRGKKILPSTTPSQQIPEFKEETNLPMVSQGFRDVPLKPHTDVKTQNLFNEGEDPFGTRHFFEASAPLQVVMEEPESVSEGKGPLRAWVSPSEVQPVSNQNSNGSGLAINSRRPHPVKPMSTIESQSPHVMKEIKVQDSTPGKLKVIDSVESGPYTQLTQEELITMVVKQQTDLTMKDAKIVELEEYIDNLLVRVIEEKPSILQSLNAAKPV